MFKRQTLKPTKSWSHFVFLFPSLQGSYTRMCSYTKRKSDFLLFTELCQQLKRRDISLTPVPSLLGKFTITATTNNSQKRLQIQRSLNLGENYNFPKPHRNLFELIKSACSLSNTITLVLERTVGKAAIFQERHCNTQIRSSLKCNNAFLKLYSVISQSCSVEGHINISVGQFLSDFARILMIVSVLCLNKKNIVRKHKGA